ncbi:hypothetical protein BDW62DRAFT_215887 [Aspergillus aurantiobrunneus]
MAAGHSGHSSPTQPIRGEITLERTRRGKYRAIGHAAIKNNLLAGVGYLELSNAGDFAANVWNEIPVPRHAVILMAIGGPIALLVSLVAVRDFYLSLRNVSVLYAERKTLQSLPSPDAKTSAVLGVNTRELGSEGIDRMLMDLLLGFGSLLVGIGTIMAIWGADHRVFRTSNLFSGFLGNSFACLFGIINACWSVYLVYRFQARSVACDAHVVVQTARPKLRRRFQRFQWHAVVNAVNGLVAGMAAMVTSRMWWGYVVLIPCVLVMIAGNLFWRMKLGYDRPAMANLLDGILAGEKDTGNDNGGDSVLVALGSVEAARGRLQDLVETGSLDSVLSFIEEEDMLEAFSVWIAENWPDHRLFAASDRVKISGEALRSGSHYEQTRMREESRQFLQKRAMILLEHRERYLLELVGEVVWRAE